MRKVERIQKYTVRTLCSPTSTRNINRIKNELTGKSLSFPITMGTRWAIHGWVKDDKYVVSILFDNEPKKEWDTRTLRHTGLEYLAVQLVERAILYIAHNVEDYPGCNITEALTALDTFQSS